MWLREYGEAIEADLAFRGIDLLDFYRGHISPRRMAVLIDNLPPESATVARSRQQMDTQQAQGNTTPRHLKSVPTLESIPVVSPGQAMRFVNAGNDEFCAMATDEAG